jgi:AcrR family transcriptional regulator
MPAAPNASPRAQRTRAALLAAGIDLLADRPIDAIPIDELVAAAGVGKGSFFNHFADKPAFAEAVSTTIRRDLEALVSAVNGGAADPLRRLAGGMVAAAAYAMARPRRAAVLVRATSGSDLEAARATASISAPDEPEAVLFWLACCQAVMGQILLDRPAPDGAVALVRGLLRLGLKGLGAAPARIDAICEPGWIGAVIAAALTD